MRNIYIASLYHIIPLNLKYQFRIYLTMGGLLPIECNIQTLVRL